MSNAMFSNLTDQVHRQPVYNMLLVALEAILSWTVLSSSCLDAIFTGNHSAMVPKEIGILNPQYCHPC